MSNRRKPKTESLRLPGRWPARHTDGTTPTPREEAGEAYATQLGLALRSDEETLGYVRKETHDALLRQLAARGDAQRSGVWWTHHQGEEALAALEPFLPLADPDPRVGVYHLELAARLAEHADATLVIAWAIGAVPEGVTLS